MRMKNSLNQFDSDRIRYELIDFDPDRTGQKSIRRRLCLGVDSEAPFHFIYISATIHSAYTEAKRN
ncbi:hypothetical protein LINGRAHAP2_LOCUS10948, partial [Linum grandiflorum]